MNEDELRIIEKRALAATAAPWKSTRASRRWEIRSHGSFVGTIFQFDFDGTLAPRAEADAEFIAHARSDVPLLVAEILRLRAVLEDIAAEGCEACLIDYARSLGECPPYRAKKALGAPLPTPSHYMDTSGEKAGET